MNRPTAVLAFCVLASYGTVVFGLDCKKLVFDTVLSSAFIIGLPNAATPGSTVFVQWTDADGNLQGDSIVAGPDGSWDAIAIAPVKPGSEIRVTGGGGGQSCVFKMPCGPDREDDCTVPTVSEWGLIVMTALGFTAGTIVFGRRRRRAAA